MLAWAISLVCGVPLQIFVVTFFRAFRNNLMDENKNSAAGSSLLNTWKKNREYENLPSYDLDDY